MAGVQRCLRRFCSIWCLLAAGCGAQVEEANEPSDAIIAEEQWRVGAISGAEWETFGNVTAVAMDAGGRVFVADAQGSVVRAYGSAGEHLGVVAREGDGPGELSHPSALTPAPDGSLWVRDSRRITRVTMSDPWAVDVREVWSGPMFPNSFLPSHFDAEGRYLYPHSRSLQRSGDPPEHFYLAFDNGLVVDTLFVPPLATIGTTDPAWVRTGASGGRILPGLNRTPFSPTPSWDLLPDGRLVSSDGAAAALQISDRGGAVVGEVTVRSGAARQVPQRERQDSLAALGARLDSVPVPLDQVLGMPASVRQREVPDVLPEVLALHVDTMGRIWVRRWPHGSEGAPTRYDVFTPEGEFLGGVALDARVHPGVAPWIGRDRMVIVEPDPLYGFDQVAVYSFAL